MRKRKVVIGLAVSAAVLAAADRAALSLCLGDDLFLGRPVAPFDPPLFSPSQHAALARIESSLESGDPPRKELRFDAELGWCPHPDSGSGEFRYDWAGCRIAGGPLPRAKAPDRTRIATLGCSMTHGDEAAAAETWCAFVDADLEDVEIANLGVAAYGLDQALLRYRRDAVPLAPDEVWLGLLPEAGLRVTTLYRPVLRHWSLDVAFKPRFVLESGALRLLPNPAQSLEDIVRLLHSQEDFLAALGRDDHWVARAPSAYAPRGSRALHRSFFGRLALSLHEAGGRDVRAHYASDAETFALLRAIIARTAAEVREHGSRFRLVILPGESDLDALEARGSGYWSALCEVLASEEDVEVLDVSERLLAARRASQEPLYAPHGHFTRRGNREAASALVEALRGAPAGD